MLLVYGFSLKIATMFCHNGQSAAVLAVLMSVARRGRRRHLRIFILLHCRISDDLAWANARAGLITPLVLTEMSH